MAKLLEQQTQLKAEGRERNVLVIVDDVVLQGRSSDSLANLAIRGRHFNVSIIMCCVSYTTIPKRMRRSLDALLVFSCPMTGDMQLLTWEFTRRAQMARYALENLEQHQCLVLETLQPGAQRLFTWRADHITLDSLVGQSESSPDGAQSTTPAVSGSAAASPPARRPSESGAQPDRSLSPASGPADARVPPESG